MKSGKAGKIDNHVEGSHSMTGGSGMKMGMGGRMASAKAGKQPSGASRKSSPAGDQFAPGKAVDGSTVGGAVDELYHQHPHNWNDLGPHHGGKENEVNEPHPYAGRRPKTAGAGKSPALGSKG